MGKDKIIKRTILPILYISIWAMMLILPRGFFLSEGVSTIMGWGDFVIVFLFLPFLLYLALKKNGVSKNLSKGIVYGSLFLFIPYIIFIGFIEEKEIQQFRKETIGITIHTYMVRYKRGRTLQNIQVKYKVGGKEYQTTAADPNEIYNVGDTVTIIYSTKTPEISRIKELMEN